MTASASLSSKKSLHRLEMKKLPFVATVVKMNELNECEFERI
jgi:hypothetical protein